MPRFSDVLKTRAGYVGARSKSEYELSGKRYQAKRDLYAPIRFLDRLTPVLLAPPCVGHDPRGPSSPTRPVSAWNRYRELQLHSSDCLPGFQRSWLRVSSQAWVEGKIPVGRCWARRCKACDLAVDRLPEWRSGRVRLTVGSADTAKCSCGGTRAPSRANWPISLRGRCPARKRRFRVRVRREALSRL
jgi:hypothetical protein